MSEHVASSVQAHATLMGSSTCERVVKCPGSVALCALSPAQPPSEAAMKGTAQHAIAEHLSIHEGDPSQFIGSEVGDVTIDAAMAADVKLALASADELLQEYTGEQLIEMRVTHTPVEVFGTGDLFAISADGKKALSADYKFGWVEVMADNYQGKFICSTAIRDPQHADMLANVEEFRLAVIQPSFEPAHTFIDVTREQIEQFGNTVDLAITTAKSPKAPYAIGKWCTYCPAKIICPAWKQRSDDLIDVMKHHKDWSPENISLILHLGKDFDKLYEEAKNRAKHELDNGRSIPGVTDYNGEHRPAWRLKPGARRQSWKHPVKDTLAVLRGFGLKTAEIQEVISPAQAKKLLPKEQHAALDEEINETRNAPSLAYADDVEGATVPVAAFARAAQAAAMAVTSRTKAKGSR